MQQDGQFLGAYRGKPTGDRAGSRIGNHQA